MRVEFPLRHIENNLVFNRNGDVWAYFSVDTLNMYVLNVTNSEFHIFSDNKISKSTFFVGYKLKPVLGGKTSFKTNIKAFFEGFTAQVRRSVGLDTQSIIEDDVRDYLVQSKRIELKLKDRISARPLHPLEIINNYQSVLNLSSEDEGGGLLDLNGVNIEPYDENTLELNNKLESQKSIYVQHLVVQEIEEVEYISSVIDMNIPIKVSLRHLGVLGDSMIIRLEAGSEEELKEHINKIYNYTNSLGISIFTPIGEQFILFYEMVLGSNKASDDYFISDREVI